VWKVDFVTDGSWKC